MQPRDYNGTPLEPARTQGQDAARQVQVVLALEKQNRYSTTKKDYDLLGEPWIVAAGGGENMVTHHELHELSMLRDFGVA